MATTKGFPVGAQWVNAFTASGLSVGTPVRIQNLTGGVMHYYIGATAPAGEDATLYPALDGYSLVDLPFSNSSASNTIWLIQQGGQGVACVTQSSAPIYQTYDSANAKAGNLFKFSARVASVAAAGTMRFGVQTGALPLTIKARYMAYLGSNEVIYRAYDGSVYTGGTVVTPLNQGRLATRLPGFSVVLNPTVTAIGTQYLPDFSTMAAGAPSASRLGTEVVGSETNLKPNTKHIFEAYNQGVGAAAPLFLQIECYEGPLDLPL